MPSASVTSAAHVNPGVRSNVRAPYRSVRGGWSRLQAFAASSDSCFSGGPNGPNIGRSPGTKWFRGVSGKRGSCAAGAGRAESTSEKREVDPGSGGVPKRGRREAGRKLTLVERAALDLSTSSPSDRSLGQSARDTGPRHPAARREVPLLSRRRRRPGRCRRRGSSSRGRRRCAPARSPKTSGPASQSPRRANRAGSPRSRRARANQNSPRSLPLAFETTVSFNPCARSAASAGRTSGGTSSQRLDPGDTRAARRAPRPSPA